MFKVYRTNRYTIYHSIVNATTIHDPSAVPYWWPTREPWIHHSLHLFSHQETRISGKTRFASIAPVAAVLHDSQSSASQVAMVLAGPRRPGSGTMQITLQGRNFGPRCYRVLRGCRCPRSLAKVRGIWQNEVNMGNLPWFTPKLWQFLSGKWISESLGTLFSDNPSWSQSCWSISRWQGRASQHTPAAKRESYT
jgi:hypothetical protein